MSASRSSASECEPFTRTVSPGCCTRRSTTSASPGSLAQYASASPAARADWGGYTGAFADPEGYVWEVAHNPTWTLKDDGSVGLG